MASARLIVPGIYKSRTFLKLSPTVRDLYTYLVLDADNDGIVEAYGVMCMINASDDDLRVLQDRGLIYVLDEEWITYIRDFQKYNKFDPRNFRVSKHRDLLIQTHPEIEPLLIVPVKRVTAKESHGTAKESHGTAKESHGTAKESHVQEKRTKEKRTKENSLYNGTRSNYDFVKIERVMLDH